MIKKIREWLDKRAEKKLLSWIATHDIKYEKYKFLFGDFVITSFEMLKDIYLSNIDDYIYGFIEDGGQFIYAYDKDVYQKVKELKKQSIPYCFTENQYETKLNYLIPKKEYIPPLSSFITNDGNIVYISSYRYIPYLYSKIFAEDEKKELIDVVLEKDIKYLWVGDDTLEDDIEFCKQKDEQYKFTIQKELVKVLYE